MTKFRFRALTNEEQATIKIVAGLGLLIFWGTTGFTPNVMVVGIVAGLLGIDTIRGFAKGSSSNNGSTKVDSKNSRSKSLSVDGGVDSSTRRSHGQHRQYASLR